VLTAGIFLTSLQTSRQAANISFKADGYAAA
jgi:hypothetical protein